MKKVTASEFDYDSWSSFESKLKSYIGKRVSKEDVDDVLSEVLLRLVKNQDTYSATNNPLAWLYKVAANVIADHHRRRATEVRVIKHIAVEQDIEAVGANETEETASQELAGCVVPFIDNLPAPYNEALMMTDIGGMSQTKAAEKLGLSKSGMKSRVQRGRNKLKQALLNCCEIQVTRTGSISDYEPIETGCYDKERR